MDSKKKTKLDFGFYHYFHPRVMTLYLPKIPVYLRGHPCPKNTFFPFLSHLAKGHVKTGRDGPWVGPFQNCV